MYPTHIHSNCTRMITIEDISIEGNITFGLAIAYPECDVIPYKIGHNKYLLHVLVLKMRKVQS